MDNLTERSPIDPKALEELLTGTFDRADLDGWNSNGGAGHFAVYVLYDRADIVTAGMLERFMHQMGTPIVAGRYGAQPLLSKDMFDEESATARGDEAPSSALYNFAMNIGFADMQKAAAAGRARHLEGIRTMFRQPGIVGFAAISEAVGFRVLTPMVKALLKTGMDIEMIKGSEESRVVMATDLTGECHRMVRWRADNVVEIEHDWDACAETVVALKILARLASGKPMPTNAEEFASCFHGQCHDD